MAQAIFGLVGVVVGAFVTGGITFALAWRAERANILAGLRLLEADLLTAGSAYEVALEEGWWAGGREAPTASWRDYRPQLARELDRSEWQTIGLAFFSVEHVWRAFELQLDLTGAPEGATLSESDRGMLENARESVGRAQRLLEAHAEPWTRRRRKRSAGVSADDIRRTPPAYIEKFQTISRSLNRIASKSEVSDEQSARQELAALRHEVREVATVASDAAEAEMAALVEEERQRAARFEATRRGYSHAPAAAGLRPWILYTFIPTSEFDPIPRLAINMRWWGDWRILCTVMRRQSDPFGAMDDEAYSAQFALSRVLIGSVYHQGNNFYVDYPRGFADARPLEPGTYEFRWSRVGARTVRGWSEGESVAVDEVDITESMLADNVHMQLQPRQLDQAAGAGKELERSGGEQRQNGTATDRSESASEADSDINGD